MSTVLLIMHMVVIVLLGIIYFAQLLMHTDLFHGRFFFQQLLGQGNNSPVFKSVNICLFGISRKTGDGETGDRPGETGDRPRFSAWMAWNLFILYVRSWPYYYIPLVWITVSERNVSPLNHDGGGMGLSERLFMIDQAKQMSNSKTCNCRVTIVVWKNVTALHWSQIKMGWILKREFGK